MATVEVLERSRQVPSLEELFDRTRALVPGIKGRVEETYRLRDLPPETFAEMEAAGLFRVYQPARWGGYEHLPTTAFGIQNILAEVCPSTSWVYGVLAIQSFGIGCFNEQAQIDVWGNDPDALACQATAPTGTAEKVEGGYRLKGRWSFASGCTFAKWGILGARIVNAPPSDGPPMLNVFLTPREAWRTIDVWHAIGLQGTGSNDLVVEDWFIPDHRRIQLGAGLQNTTIAERPGPALYRFPWFYPYSSTVSNFAAGITRGAVREFVEIVRNRVAPLTGKVAREDPAAQQVIARAYAAAEETEMLYQRHIATLADYVARDKVIPMDVALLQRTQITLQVRKLTDIVDEMMMLQGSRATFQSSPVTRMFLDLLAARTHIGNDPTTSLTMLGNLLITGQQADRNAL